MFLRMEHEEAGELDGVPIRVPTDGSYRTCSVCGQGSEPHFSFGSDESRARIAFICPEHRIK